MPNEVDLQLFLRKLKYSELSSCLLQGEEPACGLVTCNVCEVAGLKSMVASGQRRGWLLCEPGPLAAWRLLGWLGGPGEHCHSVMTFLLFCLWKRYYYYLTNGIRKDMIAPEDEEVMVRIYKLIPKVLLATPALEPLQVALRSEKERDYYYSLMKSIGKAGLVGTELLWRAQPFLCARCSAVAVTRQPESMSSEEEWFILSRGFRGLRTWSGASVASGL